MSTQRTRKKKRTVIENIRATLKIITCENVAFHAMRENVNLNGKPSSIEIHEKKNEHTATAHEHIRFDTVYFDRIWKAFSCKTEMDNQ